MVVKWLQLEAGGFAHEFFSMHAEVQGEGDTTDLGEGRERIQR